MQQSNNSVSYIDIFHLYDEHKWFLAHLSSAAKTLSYLRQPNSTLQVELYYLYTYTNSHTGALLHGCYKLHIYPSRKATSHAQQSKKHSELKNYIYIRISLSVMDTNCCSGSPPITSSSHINGPSPEPHLTLGNLMAV